MPGVVGNGIFSISFHYHTNRGHCGQVFWKVRYSMFVVRFWMLVLGYFEIASSLSLLAMTDAKARRSPLTPVYLLLHFVVVLY